MEVGCVNNTIMKFQNYKKIIFLLSLLGSLFFAFVFFYNQNREIRAQGEEELVWNCGDEIPIGEAIDETLAMLKIILDNADAMLNKAGQQVAAANQIYNLPLPDACQAGNCSSSCNLVTYDCPPSFPCDPADPFGPVCWSTCTRCDISPCAGSACPPDLLAELSSQVGLISALYPQILAHRNEIHNAMNRRPGIIAKLESARGPLEECATPASGYTEEEEVQVLRTLFSCEEAKFLKLLPEDRENCYLSPTATNFFCCRPVTP